MKVDITGTLNPSVGDWGDRTKIVCDPEEYTVSITWSDKVYHELSHEERLRLAWKTDLVKQFARFMMAGQAKGTVKYPHDEWSVEDWMAHIAGEGADYANHIMLMLRAWTQAR